MICVIWGNIVMGANVTPSMTLLPHLMQFWTRLVIKMNGRLTTLTVQARDAVTAQSFNEPTAPVAENRLYPILTQSVSSQTDLFMPMPIRK